MPSQSPSVANVTQLGLRILSAPLQGDQRSNYSDITELSAQPFQSSGQGPSPESLYFSRHSSNFLEHTVFLIQITGFFVCTFHYILNEQCRKPIASYRGNPSAKYKSQLQLLLKKMDHELEDNKGSW